MPLLLNKRIMTKFRRILCILLPLPGFFLAIALWIGGRNKAADDSLFFCFLGILANILVILPLYLLYNAFFR